MKIWKLKDEVFVSKIEVEVTGLMRMTTCQNFTGSIYEAGRPYGLYKNV